MAQLNRRQFLKIAGGVTFLALTPVAEGVFAIVAEPKNAGRAAAPPLPALHLPLFTALPYLQPGAAGKLIDGQESLIIAWQTQAKEANFVVTFGARRPDEKRATIARSEIWSGGEKRFHYAATLGGLQLGRRHTYRVTCNGATVMEGYFTTRQPRGRKIRFVAFGDNSFGEISDRAIAYQAYRANPDFVMNTGDNVYNGGLTNEYERYFFPVYNADVAGPRLGAPLLRSVPFYTVIANHDVHRTDARKHPVADFDKDSDSLAYYTNMHLPLNGPPPAFPTPIVGAEATLSAFRDAAGARFPQMANYSFDYGDAHFLCLDSNLYVDPTDGALQSWIEADLKNTDARWKFVVYHHPAFNVGDEHYAEQHMRVLAPLFERHNVDLLLHGHEHTYQRPQPLRFAPSEESGAKNLGSGDRLVPGTFTIDRAFDGARNTRANGALYVTTGAGGKHLYDPDLNENPARWRHPQDGNVDYVTRFVSDRHSLSLIELDGGTLSFTQIDENGNVIDRFRLTK